MPSVKSQPVSVFPPGPSPQTATVRVLPSSESVTVYYKSDSTVSTSTYDGTLAVGGSLSFTTPTWFICGNNPQGVQGQADLDVSFDEQTAEVPLEIVSDVPTDTLVGGAARDGRFALDQNTGVVYQRVRGVWARLNQPANSLLPGDIANLWGWWNAEQFNGAQDGELVSRWDDLSGNDRHALQSVDASKPQVKLGVQNGKAVIRFNDDKLVVTPAAALAQPCTIFVVARAGLIAATNADEGFVGGPDIYVTSAYGNFTTHGRYGMGTQFAGVNSAVKKDNAFRVITAQFDNGGNAAILRVDGVSSTGTGVGNSSSATLTFGQGRTGATHPLRGDIAEIIIYSRALTTAEIVQVERYLARSNDRDTVKTPPAKVPSRGSYSGRVGVCTVFSRDSQAFTDTHMPRLVANGVKWVREDIQWDNVEHTHGAFNWSRYDTFFANTARYGLDVLGVLAYSAAWATSVSGNLQAPPTNASDYATYCVKVLDRYGPGGTFWQGKPNAKPMTAVELWNEPHFSVFWGPEVDPAGYANLALTAARAIRAAHPEVTIVVCGEIMQGRADSTFGVPFIANVISAQPTLVDYIDVWTVHPYTQQSRDAYNEALNVDERFGRVGTVRDLTATLTGKPREVWVTEVGFSTATSHADGMTEATAALRTRNAIARCLRDWPETSYRKGIGKIFIFAYNRTNGTLTDKESNYGLIRPDESNKPAWDELGRWA